MKTEWAMHFPQLSSSRTIASLSPLSKRNLGCAILAAAIEDYQSMDEQAHASAANFLFAVSPDLIAHYDWVVAMAGGVNRAWLREALDGARARWDRQRLERRLQAKLESKVKKQLSA